MLVVPAAEANTENLETIMVRNTFSGLGYRGNLRHAAGDLAKCGAQLRAARKTTTTALFGQRIQATSQTRRMLQRAARFRGSLWRAGVVLVACAASCLAGRSATLQAGAADGRLDVYWIDVEGGAATLLVTPAGESILIDAGNPGHRDADRIFRVAVDEAGLRRIDHLVTTHYHRDHFGGAANLAEVLPIGTVHDNGEFDGQREWPEEPYKTFRAEARRVISPGDELPVKQRADAGTKLFVRCLAARQQVIDSPQAADNQTHCAASLIKPEDLSDNANSVVLLVGWGAFRFFDAGDLTWNVEQRLVCPLDRVGRVDVYQVTHHGIDASSNSVLVETLAPAVAVFNNGPQKGCEPNVVATLRGLEREPAIYQVHRNLRDPALNAPDEYIANQMPSEDCPGHFIHLAVAADASSYRVRVPATGHERTFTVER